MLCSFNPVKNCSLFLLDNELFAFGGSPCYTYFRQIALIWVIIVLLFIPKNCVSRLGVKLLRLLNACFEVTFIDHVSTFVNSLKMFKKQIAQQPARVFSRRSKQFLASVWPSLNRPGEIAFGLFTLLRDSDGFYSFPCIYRKYQSNLNTVGMVKLQVTPQSQWDSEKCISVRFIKLRIL